METKKTSPVHTAHKAIKYMQQRILHCVMNMHEWEYNEQGKYGFLVPKLN